jgi:hypothetical protein
MTTEITSYLVTSHRYTETEAPYCSDCHLTEPPHDNWTPFGCNDYNPDVRCAFCTQPEKNHIS